MKTFSITREVCPYYGSRCPEGHCWRWECKDGGGSYCSRWLDRREGPLHLTTEQTNAAEEKEADAAMSQQEGK